MSRQRLTAVLLCVLSALGVAAAVVLAQPASAGTANCGRMLKGESLKVNESMWACDSSAYLYHRPDGRIMAITAATGQVTFAINNGGKPTSEFRFDTDGALRLIAPDGTTMWESFSPLATELRFNGTSLDFFAEGSGQSSIGGFNANGYLSVHEYCSSGVANYYTTTYFGRPPCYGNV